VTGRAVIGGVKLVGIDDLGGCLAGGFERLGLTSSEVDGLAGLVLDTELRGPP
jgi:hypothetical protein